MRAKDLLRAGLSFKSYTIHDGQSDREACARFNPGLLVGQWSDAGMSLAMLLDCLMMACWAGCGDSSPAEVCYNAFCCYYWVMLNVCQSRSTGSDFLPLQTSRNICALCAHAILGACNWSEELRFAPNCREERVMEHFFSKCKAPYRGSPSLKDGVHGVQACHLQQWRECPPKVNTSKGFHRPVPAKEAKRIARQALKDAALLQSYITVDKTADTVLEELSCFWAKEGRKLFAGEGATHATSDGGWLPEDDLFAAEIDVTEFDVPPSDVAHEVTVNDSSAGDTLLAAEDRSVLVDQCHAIISQQLQPDTTEDLAAVVPADSAGESPDSQFRTLACVLKTVGCQPAFDKSTEAAKGAAGCLRRLRLLQGGIKAFCTRVRQAEGVLSKAEIKVAGAKKTNKWNYVSHQLALARQHDTFSRQKVARSVSWSRAQADACSLLCSGLSAASGDAQQPLVPIRSYRPMSCESTQVIAYRHLRPHRLLGCKAVLGRKNSSVNRPGPVFAVEKQLAGHLEAQSSLFQAILGCSLRPCVRLDSGTPLEMSSDKALLFAPSQI